MNRLLIALGVAGLLAGCGGPSYIDAEFSCQAWNAVDEHTREHAAKDGFHVNARGQVDFVWISDRTLYCKKNPNRTDGP